MFDFVDKQSEELLTDENPSSLRVPPSSASLSSLISSVFSSHSLSLPSLLSLTSSRLYISSFLLEGPNHLLTLPETTTQIPFEKTTYSILDNCSLHSTIVSRFDYFVKQSWAGSLYEPKFQMLSTLEYKLCPSIVFVFSST